MNDPHYEDRFKSLYDNVFQDFNAPPQNAHQQPLFSPSPHTHTVASNNITYHPYGPPPSGPNVQGPIEGLDELCQLLNVEATQKTNGLLLLGLAGKMYSLVDVLAAQLRVMTKLHVLLVHPPQVSGA
jgi:hypothetical protein